MKEKAREEAKEKVKEEAREKAREKEKEMGKAEKERVKKRGSWWSKGKEKLSFTAEALPPPQLAGRGGRPASSGHRSPARAAWSR